MKTSIVVIALALTPFFANAQDDIGKIKADEAACLSTAQSEMAMKLCEGQTWDAADKLLNSDYQKKTAQLQKSNNADDKETLKRLVASERAWVNFRTTDCNFQGTTDLGGSNETLDIMSCSAEMTIARIQELRQY